MAIPESQLEVWSNPGAVVLAQSTHESIRIALGSYPPLRARNYEVYLQGSYRNTTNIRGDSDVDVVVQLNSTFQWDTLALPAYQAKYFGEAYPAATYLWEDFRADVQQALRAYYGEEAVHEGNKSLKLIKASGRLDADIVPCLQYRRYVRFSSTYDENFVEGIVFYTRRENRPVINYPKLHYCNGVHKNSAARTIGWYRPVVRMFKNARNYLVDHGNISSDLAPSYFLECLLYNVPDSQFGLSYQMTYYNVLQWLWTASLQSFVCQNCQVPLFGDTAEQWSAWNSRMLIDNLVLLWKGWY